MPGSAVTRQQGDFAWLSKASQRLYSKQVIPDQDWCHHLRGNRPAREYIAGGQRIPVE